MIIIWNVFLGWKALHIAVFETKTKKDEKKDEKKGGKVEKEVVVEGGVRGPLMAVCPLYVKYNRCVSTDYVRIYCHF